jgi:adenine phosphoribosyltransferase
VVVLDDVLAAGGTARQRSSSSKVLSLVVGIEFVLELTFLHGRDKLAGYDVHSLVTY